jgi:fatty-acyl-CoA synthase
VTTIVDVIAAGPGLRRDGGGSCAVLDTAGLIAAELPWTGVRERARRIATVLADVGIGAGQRVGLLADTSLDLVCTLQAVWLAGAAVTVLPPPTRRANTLHAIMSDAALHAVVADPIAMDMLRRAPDPPLLLSLPEVAMLADRAKPAAIHHPDGRDLAVLQYTSGSTRSPRGVPVTHAHLAANVEAINSATDHSDGHTSRMLSWLPLYHDLGLIGFLAVPMWCGCSLLLQSPAAFVRRPHSWLEALSRHRVTSSGAPNFAYELMTAALTAGLDVDLDSVRFLLTGGEPVDAALMARFAEAAAARGLDPRAIVPAYGLAESTLAVTFTPRHRGIGTDEVEHDVLQREGRAVPHPGGRALVKLGPAVRGTSLRIVDRATGADVGPRQVGHVEISGPSVIGHYWGEPAPAPGTWLRTGDLGYLADGELVVCGREKDVLFAAGRNIFPQDVEAAAAEVPGVRAGCVAAFGLSDQRGDRLVVAVESRATDPEVVRRGVAAAVLTEVGLAPHTVVLLPAGRLPKTSSGKLRRAETRRLYQCGELTI